MMYSSSPSSEMIKVCGPYVVAPHLKTKIIINLDFYNFSTLSLMIVKLEMTICVIHCNCKLDETIPELIQRSELSVESELPTSGHRIFCY